MTSQWHTFDGEQAIQSQPHSCVLNGSLKGTILKQNLAEH